MMMPQFLDLRIHLKQEHLVVRCDAVIKNKTLACVLQEGGVVTHTLYGGRMYNVVKVRGTLQSGRIVGSILQALYSDPFSTSSFYICILISH